MSAPISTPRIVHDHSYNHRFVSTIFQKENKLLSFLHIFPITGLLVRNPQNNRGEHFAEMLKCQTLLENPTGEGVSVGWVPFVTDCKVV